MSLNKELKKQTHIAIFELHSEEESIITLFAIFKECNYKVSLILSHRIWSLIKDTVRIKKEDTLIVFEKNKSFKHIFIELDRFLKAHTAHLIIFPGFRSNSIRKTIKYLKLFKKYPVCVGIFNYSRWFASFPPIIFNGWKIMKRTAIMAWISCHIVFKYISAYFVSDIHRNSSNPFKRLIRDKTNKKIFDFPFKLMENSYNPSIKYDFPIFVIPGKIDKERRDYLTILKIISNISKQYRWNLILLGRPIGSYGKEVLKTADNINHLIGERRIEFFNEYISKDEFDRFMNSATHIIAPVTKTGYQFGKDSGALYDIFKYNKIGIFDNSYFYNDSLIEKKVIITFQNEQELHEILNSIVRGSYSYDDIQKEFESVSSYFNESKYISYLKNEIDNYIYRGV